MKYINCPDRHGSHRMAYREWGNSQNPQVLICVHGLTRNSRDFDDLAQALAEDYRVICPDIVGRGESDWLIAGEDYNFLTYVADIQALITQLNLKQVDWLGTSMGGIIGMLLAATPNSPLRRLILNDVGALTTKETVVHIATYLIYIWENPPLFANLQAVEIYIRQLFASFGQLSDAQWRHLAQYSVKPHPTGGYSLNCDPNIAIPYQMTKIENLQALDLWEVWKILDCPILLLHGVESKVLLPETIQQMQHYQPTMQVHDIAHTGHAPALMDVASIRWIKAWLKSKNQ